MAVNILDLAKTALTPDIMQKVSALIGESPANTQKAVDGAIPSVLAGLLNFASSNADGPARLINLLTQGNLTNLLGNLSGLLSGGSSTQDFLKTGKDLLGIVFGGKLGALTDLVANSSGIKGTSATSLLSLLAPLLLGLLGRETTSQGLNPANLVSLLLGQKDLLSKAAPAGLAGVLGLANLGNLGSSLADTAARVATGAASAAATRAVETTTGGSGVGKWVIPLLLAGLLIPWFLFSRGCSEQPAPVAQHEMTPPPVARPTPPPPPPAPVAQPTPPPAPAAPPVESIALPGGASISLTSGSFNYRLAKFLADTADPTVPRTFVFDNLNFEFGTTKLTPESEQTVKDLIAILSAYPSTEARLEGHTDSVGDAEANKKLSQDRADSVKAVMEASGIAPARLSTMGHGQEKPTASNDTEEGRAQNRRLELVVVKK
ncbi:MAG: OmpA family protein [Deltaproteobacteria bacterium]|nr:OmpA family protein [Deltaproteobacteria bacterium]